jgi:hypothetical protein
MKITIIEALTTWLSGQSVSDKMLWGLQILWWGRLGKVLCFVSGATVIAEIMGPKRLADSGHSLQKLSGSIREEFLFTYRLFKATLGILYHWFIGGDKYAEVSEGYEKLKAKLKAEHYSSFCFFNLINLTISSVLSVLSTIYIGYIGPIAFIIVAIISVSFIGPLISFSLLSVIRGLFYFLARIIIIPFSNVLRKNNLSIIVKVISLVLLVVGFLLDLLAS